MIVTRTFQLTHGFSALLSEIQKDDAALHCTSLHVYSNISLHRIALSLHPSSGVFLT